MASKTVNEILQAERQADLAVEQAHAQAKELIRQAREDGASLLAEQTNLARQEADVLRRETKEQAEEILRKMEQEATGRRVLCAMACRRSSWAPPQR